MASVRMHLVRLGRFQQGHVHTGALRELGMAAMIDTASGLQRLAKGRRTYVLFAEGVLADLHHECVEAIFEGIDARNHRNDQVMDIRDRPLLARNAKLLCRFCSWCPCND